MKSKDSGSNKAFLQASSLGGSATDGTCTGKKPVWSDDQEAIFQALGEAKTATDLLGELLRLQSAKEEGFSVPDGTADEIRSAAHSTLCEAAGYLEAVDGGEGQ